MISADNVFLCAGLRAALAYRKLIAARGLQLEVQEFVSAHDFGPHAATAVSRLKRVKRILSLRTGFHAPFMHLNFWSRSAERADAAWRALIESLDIAAELESEFVVVHSLYVPRRRNPDYGENWPERAPAFFARVVEEAASRGLSVAIENLLEPSPDTLLRLISSLGANVSVCLDVGHSAIAGGASPAEWVTALGPRLRHIHLSDNRGVHDDHLALGEGTVDIASALHAAAQMPHRISLGIECRLRPSQNVTRSLKYLTPFLGIGDRL